MIFLIKGVRARPLKPYRSFDCYFPCCSTNSNFGSISQDSFRFDSQFSKWSYFQTNWFHSQLHWLVVANCGQLTIVTKQRMDANGAFSANLKEYFANERAMER